jgi:cupin fold WbuC family metalloprotein
MFIVHTRSTYVRPHKHLGKSESFHVLEGRADVVIFDDEGHIVEVIQTGDYGSRFPFYYRLSTPLFHTLLIRSAFLLFHESTGGPFVRSDTQFAPWSPDESSKPETVAFMERLEELVAPFLNSAHEA